MAADADRNQTRGKRVRKIATVFGKRPDLLITRMETVMNYEQTMTLKEVEYDLIEWAGSGEEGEDLPTCLAHWDLDEEQLEIIKEACAVPHAAASVANAMWCITDGDGLSSIAEVLRTH